MCAGDNVDKVLIRAEMGREREREIERGEGRGERIVTLPCDLKAAA